MEDKMISFGPVDKMTIGILRVIHRTLLPVRYSDEIYRTIKEGVMAKGELAYYNNDVAVGEICYRIEKNGDVSKLYIMTIGVLPTYQKLGIATKLLNRIVEKSEGISEIYLHVSVTNEGAMKFYEKQGFTRLEKVEKYYKSLDEGDAYIYSKKI